MNAAIEPRPPGWRRTQGFLTLSHLALRHLERGEYAAARDQLALLTTLVDLVEEQMAGEAAGPPPLGERRGRP